MLQNSKFFLSFFVFWTIPGLINTHLLKLKNNKNIKMKYNNFSQNLDSKIKKKYINDNDAIVNIFNIMLKYQFGPIHIFGLLLFLESKLHVIVLINKYS